MENEHKSALDDITPECKHATVVIPMGKAPVIPYGHCDICNYFYFDIYCDVCNDKEDVKQITCMYQPTAMVIKNICNKCQNGSKNCWCMIKSKKKDK